MCGRYVKEDGPETWAEVHAFLQPIQPRLDPDDGPRYNIVPSTKAPIISAEGENLVMENVRWAGRRIWRGEDAAGDQRQGKAGGQRQILPRDMEAAR